MSNETKTLGKDEGATCAVGVYSPHDDGAHRPCGKPLPCPDPNHPQSPSDKKAREPGCKCDREEGDSPCPVHGEEEAPADHPQSTKEVADAGRCAVVDSVPSSVLAAGGGAPSSEAGGSAGQENERVAAAPVEPGASATPRPELGFAAIEWEMGLPPAPLPQTARWRIGSPAGAASPAEPAEPRRPAIVIRPPQEQLGKEGVEAAPEVAPQPPSAGRRLWETRNDPPLPGLVDAIRVADEAFADETEPHAFEPDPTCKVCGDPPDAAAHVAHGAPPSTAGAAAVPEAEALAEIDFVADWLAVTCPEPANRLRRARRALSSPSGDARPTPFIETLRALVTKFRERAAEAEKYALDAVRLGRRYESQALDYRGAAWRAASNLLEAELSPAVAPSIPEEPKAASQKDGGDDAER